MAEAIELSRGQVNQWLKTLSADPLGPESVLDDRGVALITREDGRQLILRLAGDLLGLYVVLFQVPEEKANEFYKIALIFNLHPTLVGSGHLAYDDAARTLTFCAQMPMEVMTEEFFGRLVVSVFTLSDELRDQFFTLAGVPSPAEPAAVA